MSQEHQFPAQLIGDTWFHLGYKCLFLITVCQILFSSCSSVLVLQSVLHFETFHIKINLPYLALMIKEAGLHQPCPQIWVVNTCLLLCIILCWKSIMHVAEMLSKYFARLISPFICISYIHSIVVWISTTNLLKSNCRELSWISKKTWIITTKKYVPVSIKHNNANPRPYIYI